MRLKAEMKKHQEMSLANVTAASTSFWQVENVINTVILYGEAIEDYYRTNCVQGYLTVTLSFHICAYLVVFCHLLFLNGMSHRLQVG
jgi:hypothetical protein